jgi:hypothetical protein
MACNPSGSFVNIEKEVNTSQAGNVNTPQGTETGSSNGSKQIPHERPIGACDNWPGQETSWALPLGTIPKSTAQL